MVAVGYGNGSFAPCIKLFGFGEYLAAHHMLIAHARAYRAYDSDFRVTQKGRLTPEMSIFGQVAQVDQMHDLTWRKIPGKITIGLNMMYHWPKTDSMEDEAAAERAMQFQVSKIMVEFLLKVSIKY